MSGRERFTEDAPFYVEKDREDVSCSVCNSGLLFDVVYGPKDTSWDSYGGDDAEEGAESQAHALNEAFALGFKHGRGEAQRSEGFEDLLATACDDENTRLTREVATLRKELAAAQDVLETVADGHFDDRPRSAEMERIVRAASERARAALATAAEPSR